MFDILCTYPLPADLFSQAIHPSEPLIAVGLASGHVQTFRLPATPSSASSTTSDHSIGSNGCGTIDTLWKTRRHTGSCRSIEYSSDGAKLFSAGTDGLVKMADTHTGKVESKIAIPSVPLSGNPDAPALLHALTPQTLILGTDSAAVHIYDLRERTGSISDRPTFTHHPHDDYISSITALPPSDASTSGFSKQWISTGGTTLAITDVRKGVLVKSEDQEEELLSSCFVSDLPKKGSSVGSKVLIGGAGGVLTLWEKGVWDDQDERIAIDSGRGGGESLDVLANVPSDLGKNLVAVGLGNGNIRIVKIGPNKVVADARHDELESVIALGFEAEGRMVSGGGQIVKIWQEAIEGDEDEEDEDGLSPRKHSRDSSEEVDDDDSEDSTDEESARQQQNKKRKKGKPGGKQNGLSFKDLD